MILVYNFLLTFLFLLLLPVLVPVVIFREKYRGRSLERLGFKTPGVKIKLSSLCSGDGPVLWIHALSVGEVTSALPLIKAVRQDMAQAVIIFTVATRSGRQVADALISTHADIILYSPFDLWFSVQRYITAIRPDLFILVETDFWPNWLWQLKDHRIPAMLVNGRISEKSFTAYNRFLFFFRSVFSCFDILSMQTAGDAEKMVEIGIPSEKILTLGNLKYDMDTTPGDSPLNRTALAVEESTQILVCGSTHPGEEVILLKAFKELATDNDLFLILAPRDITRGRELVDLARQAGLKAQTRQSGATGGNVLILDTIGELSSCYSLARLAFVGGSLVEQGGHNPIEPAAYGVPVLFGSHMEDFAEIARDLVHCGGAEVVTANSFTAAALIIVQRDVVHAAMAGNAKNLVDQQRGGMVRHLKAIHQLLEK